MLPFVIRIRQLTFDPLNGKLPLPVSAPHRTLWMPHVPVWLAAQPIVVSGPLGAVNANQRVDIIGTLTVLEPTEIFHAVAQVSPSPGAGVVVVVVVVVGAGVVVVVVVGGNVVEVVVGGKVVEVVPVNG